MLAIQTCATQQEILNADTFRPAINIQVFYTRGWSLGGRRQEAGGRRQGMSHATENTL